MTLTEIKEKQLIQKAFLWVWMYAVFGWCYEVFMEVVVKRWGFHNRGVLFGPYCPIYGVGALLFIVCFSGLMKKKEPKWLVWVKPVIIFLGCMAVATTVELIASYIMDIVEYTRSSDKLNFQARIALPTSIRFGIGGVLFLYVIQPFYEWLTNKPSRKVLNIITVAVLLIVLTDFIYVKATGYEPVLAEVPSS